MRRGGNSGRAHGRARFDDGAGNYARDCRIRRRFGRTAIDARRARHALRDTQLHLGSEQSALRREADDPRLVGSRVSYLLHTATVAAPFTTDHLFLSTLTMV